MNEVMTVARKRGAVLADDLVESSLAWLDKGPAWPDGNMQDILDGHPSELETETGVIVRMARTMGIEVPRHEFLYASLLPQERRARGEVQFAEPVGVSAS